MKKLFYIAILSGVFSLSGKAQVTVDQKIVMTSSDSLQRSIKGLHYSSDSTAMISVLELVSNRLLFSETANDDTLLINLPVTTSIQEGSLIWIQNSVNTNPGLVVSSNGMDFYPVMTDVFTTAGDDCIKQNELE